MDDPSPAIRARGLCFSYPGREVLHDVDLEAGYGTVTAITGPNGSGKSTLLELLAGVRSPGRGRVERRGDVALVVQRPSAPEGLPLTVRETVAMGTWGRRRLRRRNARDTIAEMLEVVGLSDLGGRPFGELSGGQRQRTLLAQALARRAGMVIMDEPDSGLDTESRRRIHDLLVDLARSRGVCVVCATHDNRLVSRAQHVVRLDGGRASSHDGPAQSSRLPGNPEVSPGRG